jgi:UDP-N-acetylmuramoyl-L-alanyl-D-glutamate--2,6-diaminopimelate ligase
LKLAHLLKSEAVKPYEIVAAHGDEPRLESIEITGVAFDSRRVQPGYLFVCVPGFQTDGHDFASQAVDAGAVALVVERLLPNLPHHVVQIKVDDARSRLGHLAARFFDYPASRLATVGITGTNGKTSAAFLCETVLRLADQAPGLIGTIRAKVGEQERSVRNTTPEASDLQELLSDMVAAGNRSVVMEVSSHALALHRVAGIPFDVAVFTNLSQDHLDFHSSMDEYFEIKKRLFTGLGQDWSRPAPPYAIVNYDDPRSEQLLSELKVPYITYGFKEGAHVRATDLEFGPEGSRFVVRTPVGDAKAVLRLAGAFNVANALAAVGVGLARRVELDEIVTSLSTLDGIPGRFELVREGQDFTVLVDYAHTPDGLENVLLAAKEVTTGRLISVFGCGGDRDVSKRSKMGEVAARYCDRVFLTSDNPRTESPCAILDQIEEGVLKVGEHVDYIKEVDREAAIASAIRAARPGDTVVIAGKGHERVQVFADHKIVFDDRDVARRVICARLGKVQRNSSLSTANLLWTECRKPLRHVYRDLPMGSRAKGRAAL